MNSDITFSNPVITVSKVAVHQLKIGVIIEQDYEIKLVNTHKKMVNLYFAQCILWKMDAN